MVPCGERLVRSPGLAVPADVLAFVFADHAPLGRGGRFRVLRSVRQALARAALVSLSALAAAPLLAQSLYDTAPFSADPKALLAAAQKVEAKEQSVVYLLEEATFSFEADGRSKSVWHEIKSTV